MKDILALMLVGLFLLTGVGVGFAETLTTDVAVIGAGGSGLAAAVTAAEGGAKVILFEKQAYTGGTSLHFQGTFAAGSEMQRQRYIGYTTDEAFKNFMDYSHWRANPRLVRAFVNESPGTIEWLQKQGVEFLDATINMPDGIRVYHTVKGNGTAVVKALVDKAKEKGVDIRLATPVTKLIKEGGRIVGVIAEKDGKTIETRAKAVVIATGGYGNNKEWIKKYTGFDLDVNMIPIAQVGKQGDGIRMAWEAGGDEQGTGVLLGMRIGPFGPGVSFGNSLECASAQPNLWVNHRGERFCDEALHFNDAVLGVVAAAEQGGYSYTIFDETIKAEMATKGIDRGLANANPPGKRLTTFDADFRNAVEKGNVNIHVADSVEGLAGKIGVDPAVLKKTVEEYNGFCEKGRDEFFAKDRKYLKPLRGPRFYAIKSWAIFLGTLGGIKTNEAMEVVDKKGKPIPGLYAAGSDVGGLYGDTYPMEGTSGAASAFALTSGRMAGKSLLRYIGQR